MKGLNYLDSIVHDTMVDMSDRHNGMYHDEADDIYWRAARKKCANYTLCGGRPAVHKSLLRLVKAGLVEVAYRKSSWSDHKLRENSKTFILTTGHTSH